MLKKSIQGGGAMTPREKRWRMATALLLLIMLAVMAASFTSGTFEQAGEHTVTGWDMVLGRQIEGYKYGLQKQMMAVLTVLLAAAALILLIPNRDKPTFLAALCTVGAMCTLFMLQFPSPSMKRFDPVIAGILKHGLSAWYWIALAVAVTAAVSAGLMVAGRPPLRKDIVAHRWLYGMALPVFVYVIVFFYYPIYGVIIAFKDFMPRFGILNSPWIGFNHFLNFFNSFYFSRLITNTLVISLLDLIFGFTAPILFALLLNEVRRVKFQRIVQTFTYLPHFISLVVICGLLRDFFSSTGLINGLLGALGVPESQLVNHLADPRKFRGLYTASGIWQSMGWGSIIYLSALTNIDPQLYEAARVDGASRARMMWSITLPGIMVTIVTMLILRVGNIMNVGYEKIILLYTPATYETADVISTYVYRSGILNSDYSFSAAVGLFNSVISLVLVVASNKISKRVTEVGIW